MTDRTCDVDGCERRHRARGLCQTHYRRTTRGTPLDQPVRDVADRTEPKSNCIENGCADRAVYRGRCKRHYQNNYMREIHSTRRAEWVASQGGKCAACGSTTQIEIDHVDPRLKEREIALIWSCSERVRARELAKCQLLCKECHKAKSAREQKRHGVSSYRGGCRCEDCCAAYRESIRRQIVRRRTLAA